MDKDSDGGPIRARFCALTPVWKWTQTADEVILEVSALTGKWHRSDVQIQWDYEDPSGTYISPARDRRVARRLSHVEWNKDEHVIGMRVYIRREGLIATADRRSFHPEALAVEYGGRITTRDGTNAALDTAHKIIGNIEERNDTIADDGWHGMVSRYFAEKRITDRGKAPILTRRNVNEDDEEEDWVQVICGQFEQPIDWMLSALQLFADEEDGLDTRIEVRICKKYGNKAWDFPFVLNYAAFAAHGPERCDLTTAIACARRHARNITEGNDISLLSDATTAVDESTDILQLLLRQGPHPAILLAAAHEILRQADHENLLYTLTDVNTSLNSSSTMNDSFQDKTVNSTVSSSPLHTSTINDSASMMPSVKYDRLWWAHLVTLAANMGSCEARLVLAKAASRGEWGLARDRDVAKRLLDGLRDGLWKSSEGLPPIPPRWLAECLYELGVIEAEGVPYRCAQQRKKDNPHLSPQKGRKMSHPTPLTTTTTGVATPTPGSEGVQYKIPPDLGRAINTWSLAAQLGHEPAKFNLRRARKYGYNVPPLSPMEQEATDYFSGKRTPIEELKRTASSVWDRWAHGKVPIDAGKFDRFEGLFDGTDFWNDSKQRPKETKTLAADTFSEALRNPRRTRRFQPARGRHRFTAPASVQESRSLTGVRFMGDDHGHDLETAVSWSAGSLPPVAEDALVADDDEAEFMPLIAQTPRRLHRASDDGDIDEDCDNFSDEPTKGDSCSGGALRDLEDSTETMAAQALPDDNLLKVHARLAAQELEDEHLSQPLPSAIQALRQVRESDRPLHKILWLLRRLMTRLRDENGTNHFARVRRGTDADLVDLDPSAAVAGLDACGDGSSSTDADASDTESETGDDVGTLDPRQQLYARGKVVFNSIFSRRPRRSWLERQLRWLWQGALWTFVVLGLLYFSRRLLIPILPPMLQPGRGRRRLRRQS
eukprot:Clim_evm22s108 gene=Clim_evmTU22s108